MTDTTPEPTLEEMIAELACLAKTIVRLLAENLTSITEFEADGAKRLGVSESVYNAAIPLKNITMNFFNASAAGFLYSDDRPKCPLVEADGSINDKVMGALSSRYGVNLSFPQFSIPFGEALGEAADSLKTTRWHLVRGEGKALYFQAIGERISPKVTTRQRATVIKPKFSHRDKK
jgi:hypothetical protein